MSKYVPECVDVFELAFEPSELAELDGLEFGPEKVHLSSP